MSGRGVYRSSEGHGTLIGNVLYHTIGDREEALRLLKLDVAALYQELTKAILHVTPEHPYGLASDTTINPAHLVWWRLRGSPFFDEFNDFYAARNPANWSRSGGYVAMGEQFTTDWDTYKSWRDRLVELRREAGSMGVRVQVVEPTKLPTTVIEKAEALGEKLGEKVTGIGSYLKYAIAAGLGIAGIALVTGAVRDRAR